MASNHSNESKPYRETPHGAAACAWNRLTSRAGSKYGYSKCYSNVEVRMTRDDFMAWAIPQYTDWFQRFPDVTPSIDRKDSTGHYEVSNLQLIPVQENRRKARHFINDNAPEGTLWCNACQTFLPFEKFYKMRVTRANPQGLSRWCKECSSCKARESHLRNHPPGDTAFKEKQAAYNRLYKAARRAFSGLPETGRPNWKDFLQNFSASH